MYEMEDRQGISEAKVHEQRDALAGELFEKIIGAMEVASVYLGDRLGLYRALAEGGPATPAELAERTGTHERYAREWLSLLTSAGYLAYDPAEGRFTLPPEHAAPLAHEGGPGCLAGSY